MPVKYRLTDAAGKIIDRVGAFANLIVANLQAGLLTSNKLISPVVETNLISPLADESDVRIRIGKSDTSPSSAEATEGQGGFGQLIIQDSSGSAVASIDTAGNASFSGELYADTIKSKTLDEIQELLRKVETDQNLLAQAATWNTNTATSAGQLDNLTARQLFITDQAAISSLSVTNSLAIGTDMIISNTSGEPKLTPEVSINTLSLPLSLQSLAMAPVEIMAGKVKIDTDGNMIIIGNLNIAGDLEVGGKTKLKEVQLERLIVANSSTSWEPGLTPEVSSTSATIDTNAIAGKAVIPAGSDQIIINNPNITDYTLIYVTPTSTTENSVLYVKSKEAGKFTVGFTNAIEKDVSFNWWVIENK